MTNITPNTAATQPKTVASPAESKQIMLKEIGVKWNKFSTQELGALKSKDDLVTQVVAKYSLDKVQAQRDVDTLVKGRQF